MQALQTKVAKLETLLQQLHPGEDFTARVGITLTRNNWMQKGVLGDLQVKTPGGVPPVAPVAEPHKPPASIDASHSSTTVPTSSNSFSPYPLLVGNTVTSTPESNDDENDVVVKLNELTLLSTKLKQAHVGNYYGKSSNKALMMNAFALFKELDATPSVENTVNELDMMRSEFWESQPVRRPDIMLNAKTY